MMAVYPDGYIAGVYGPYPGKTNDASIMNELLEKDYWSAFKEGDVLIIDRGFRDSIVHIEKKGTFKKCYLLQMVLGFLSQPNKPMFLG